MAKCYYCGDEVSNDDLTELNGTFVRICADCRDFIKEYGTAPLEDDYTSDIKATKQYYREWVVDFSKIFKLNVPTKPSQN